MKSIASRSVGGRPTGSAPFAALEPWDEHNRRLAANVHPSGWANPEAREKYHLLVVGGGTGGLVTAAIASALGAKVALVERSLLGGDCLNVGCVPSKALIAASRGWRAARAAADATVDLAPGAGAAFGAAMERMRGLRADISVHDSAERFTGLGVDVFLGQAAFTAPETASVAGQTLRFRRAVIATGTRPTIPWIPGLRGAGFLTNETVFSLTKLPERLLVIGCGPVGCELAQAFAAFGTQVTLVEAGRRILSKDDPEAAEVVARQLRSDGVRIECGVTVRSIDVRDGERIVHYTQGEGERQDEIATDQILLATGRQPNVNGLGLRAAGVVFDRRQGIEVDDRLRTSNPRIYAIGDIGSPFPFTHSADAQARLVVRNALFFGRGKARDLVIPWCTYTSPELAHVGMSHSEAAEHGADIITVPLAEVDRARLEGEEEGFLRVYLEAGSDTILGATLVAENAGDLISQITQAMVAGVGLGKLGETIFPYPTRAEVFRKAADQWRRGKLTPTARRLFGYYFGVTGGG